MNHQHGDVSHVADTSRKTPIIDIMTKRLFRGVFDPPLMVARLSADDLDMPLTRRTPRFAELAAATDDLLGAAGLQVTSAAVDLLLNAHVDAVAQVLGVSPRSALVHAPDSLPRTVLTEVIAASGGAPGRPALHVVAN